MGYEVEIEPEDLPDELPPGLDIENVPEEAPTPLESFIEDGDYVVYKQ